MSKQNSIYASYSDIPKNLRKNTRPSIVRISGRPDTTVSSWLDVLEVVGNAVAEADKALPLSETRSKNDKHVRVIAGKRVYTNINATKVDAHTRACVDTLGLPVEVECVTTEQSNSGLTVRYSPSSQGVQALHPRNPAIDLAVDDPVWRKRGSDITEDDLANIETRGRLAGRALLMDALALGRLRNHLISIKEDWIWMKKRYDLQKRRLQDYSTLARVVDGKDETVTLDNPIEDGVGHPPESWPSVEVAVMAVRTLRQEAEEKNKTDEDREREEREREAKERQEAVEFAGEERWKDMGETLAHYVETYPDLAEQVVDHVVGAALKAVESLAAPERRALLVDANHYINEAIAAAEAEMDAMAAK